MHYSSGNYEAFVRPRKPEGADKKTAWFVGSGLAGLAGAAFLIRDGGVADPDALRWCVVDVNGMSDHDDIGFWQAAAEVPLV